MPNRATAFEMSPTSHIVTIPSFFSPPPPPATTTTDARPPPPPSSPPVNARNRATPGWARRSRRRPTTPPTAPRHRPQTPSTTPSTNTTSLAPDAANKAAKSATSPPLDTAADAPQPCHVTAPDDTNSAPQYRHVTTYRRPPKRRQRPVPRHCRKYEQEATRGVGREEQAETRGEEEEGQGDDDGLFVVVVSRSFRRRPGIRGAGGNDVLRRYPPAFSTAAVGYDGAYGTTTISSSSPRLLDNDEGEGAPLELPHSTPRLACSRGVENGAVWSLPPPRFAMLVIYPPPGGDPCFSMVVLSTGGGVWPARPPIPCFPPIYRGFFSCTGEGAAYDLHAVPSCVLYPPEIAGFFFCCGWAHRGGIWLTCHPSFILLHSKSNKCIK